MYCDDCKKAAECEGRDSWIFSEQFALCEQAGHPDYCDDNHFIYAGITCDDEGKEEEETMEAVKEKPVGGAKKKSNTRRGTCINCKREDMIIVSGGLDWMCWKAAKGLTGADREQALLDIKKRIDGGYMRLWGKNKKQSQKAEIGKSPAATNGDGGTAKGQENYLEETREAAIELRDPSRLPPVAVLEETAAPQTCIPVLLQLTVEITVRVNGVTV